MSKPFYLTTAIAYVNGLPHLGHAYEAILSDAIVRFKRLDGYDVFFLTGTDEHGEKVAKTAEKNGMTPKAFADMNAQGFLDMDRDLNISFDDFIRTTEPRHYKAAQAMWERLQARGDIYLGKYEGWYSVREEAYFTEDELIVDAQTGQKRTPQGTEVEWVVEPSYFFKLSAYTEKLLALYEQQPEFIQPAARRNEIISFVKQGLKDLSVSRHKSRLNWGIPVPGDDDHVMYVWLDALTNYITALGYPDMESVKFKSQWPAAHHIIGKDIIRFHCVYWPAFLMSAAVDLPRVVFAHGFINVQGEKMSKSIGNVLSPDDLIKAYGVDALRYFLLRDIPHGQDGNFAPDHAVQRMNADLANGIGNLAQRTLSFVFKNCEGKIPGAGALQPADQELLVHAYEKTLPRLRAAMNEFRPDLALAAVAELVSAADGYIDAQAPWTLRKTDPARMQTVLYVLCEVIRCAAIMMQWATPQAIAALLTQMNVPENQRQFAHVGVDHALKPDHLIEQPAGVFPRIELPAVA
ncbi:MAG: methionine--tRNA ligase [Alphaproteobacteria bacterium]|nr:methionine--tRNA ligase [Alphaproteobacteria bacterium]